MRASVVHARMHERRIYKDDLLLRPLPEMAVSPSARRNVTLVDRAAKKKGPSKA